MSRLEDALRDELALRSRLNALVRERADAVTEARRLRERARLDGAADDLEELAARWDAVAQRVENDIDARRAALREQEGVVARVRAEEAGA
ncbi:MAG TPA: hypothetical protein VGV36_02010 [Solirubrobacteraceae bacterium]|nr:hypothetical protein [Solirubrobacteraceae bacterium]